MSENQRKDAFDVKLDKLLDESDRQYLGEDFTAKVMQKVSKIRKPSPVIRFTRIALPLTACAAAVIICVSVGLDRLLPKSDSVRYLATDGTAAPEASTEKAYGITENEVYESEEVPDPRASGSGSVNESNEALNEEKAENEYDYIPPEDYMTEMPAEKPADDTDSAENGGLADVNGIDTGMTDEMMTPAACPPVTDMSLSFFANNGEIEGVSDVNENTVFSASVTLTLSDSLYFSEVPIFGGKRLTDADGTVYEAVTSDSLDTAGIIDFILNAFPVENGADYNEAFGEITVVGTDYTESAQITDTQSHDTVKIILICGN